MNAKKPEVASKPRKNKRLDGMMRDLTASLHTAITETASDALEKDADDSFTDLACRFLSELQKRGLIVAALPTSEERIDRLMAQAAANSLATFTEWMRNNPGCSYDTRMSVTGKFQLIARTAEGPKLFFGGDVQDVYGQVANVIRCDGGKL